MVLIHEVGSNGTAAISWEGGFPKWTKSRSNAGGHSLGMRVKFERTVILGISSAAADKDKRCCNGLTIP